MKKKEIYIHIGMHKTATSFLQYNFFPNMKDFYFVHDPKKDKQIYDIVNDIVNTHPVCHNIDALRGRVDDYMNRLKEQRVIISMESLVGNMCDSYLDFEKNIGFIKTIFPSASILLTFRRQDKWLESAYKQLLHEYWSISFRQYTEKYLSLQGLPRFDYRTLDYLYMHKTLTDSFDNVAFLPFEMFVRSRSDFIDKLCAFFGIDKDDVNMNSGSLSSRNRGYSLISAKIAFVFNRFFCFPQNTLGFLTLGPIKRYFIDRYDKNAFFKFMARVLYRFSFRIFLQRGLDRIIYIPYNPMPDDFKARILEHHKSSNKELSEKLGIDLSEYGYC